MAKKKYEEKKFLSYILNFKIIVLISNFFFQGMRYMSAGELLYKISITIILSLLIFLIIENFFLSLLIAHFINYILNGQYFVLFRYLSVKSVMSRENLYEFIKIINNLIARYKPKDVLVIGSLCRGKMNPSSDLDLRVYHKPDFKSSLKAYIMATRLRFLGLILKFPVDVYCFSDLSFLAKISDEETPVNFLENEKILKIYPLSERIDNKLKNLIIE